jgi:hypothetical protein
VAGAAGRRLARMGTTPLDDPREAQEPPFEPPPERPIPLPDVAAAEPALVPPGK